jgi:TorA maturation chaperone TorD
VSETDFADEGDFAESRSRIYRLLALIFAEEPRAATIRQIRAEDMRESLCVAGIEFSPVFLDAPEEELLEDLAVEYTRLFVGPGKHLVPNESVQRGEDRYWGDHTVHVADFYARFGYQVADERNFIPDHLASELEFMGHLAAEESKRWAAGDAPGGLAKRTAQVEFLREHLLAWGPAFCSEVARETETEYFAGFSKLTRSVLTSEAANLGLAVGLPATGEVLQADAHRFESKREVPHE